MLQILEISFDDQSCLGDCRPIQLGLLHEDPETVDDVGRLAELGCDNAL